MLLLLGFGYSNAQYGPVVSLSFDDGDPTWYNLGFPVFQAGALRPPLAGRAPISQRGGMGGLPDPGPRDGARPHPPTGREVTRGIAASAREGEDHHDGERTLHFRADPARPHHRHHGAPARGPRGLGEAAGGGNRVRPTAQGGEASNGGMRSRSPAAVFELLPAPAGAGIISTNFDSFHFHFLSRNTI